MSSDSNVVPKHLGLILDGNRRWAKENGLLKLEGHKVGYDNLTTIARHAFDSGIEYVSAYVFSTENWNRAKDEVSYLMDLAIRMAKKDAAKLAEENVKIVVLGVEDRVPKKVIKAWRKAEEDSKNNTGGVLAFCFNYGGIREITDAVRKIVASGVDEDKVTEALVSSSLYHPEIPNVDFMIRPGGEKRISNFMLPRMAYAELYFIEKFWPEFSKADLEEALKEYAKRQRRHGA
jgi:undecaprenyl diphosphate synthase